MTFLEHLVESSYQIIRLTYGKTGRRAGLSHRFGQAEVPWVPVMQEAPERFFPSSLFTSGQKM